MGTVEKIIGTMLMLVLVYLLVKNDSGVATVVNSLASGGSNIFKTLQGR